MTAYLVGLTGGLGTGKSTVLAMFSRLGARTLSSDDFVKEAWKPGSPVYLRLKSLVKSYGLLESARAVNLKRVAREAFQNKEFRRRLEKILHPLVFRKINLARKREKGILVIEVPLLFETGFHREADLVVTVTTSKTISLARLRKNRGLSPREWEARARAQWPLQRKVKKAGVVIHNDGSLTETRRQVQKIWKQLNLVLVI